MAAVATPTKNGVVKSPAVKCLNFKMQAPAMIGIDRKNENRAEDCRSYPSINATEIVVPALENPGITAKP